MRTETAWRRTAPVGICGHVSLLHKQAVSPDPSSFVVRGVTNFTRRLCECFALGHRGHEQITGILGMDSGVARDALARATSFVCVKR